MVTDYSNLPTIHFAYNISNKLCNYTFTKLTEINPNYYKTGRIYNIFLHKYSICIAQLISISEISYCQLTDMHSYIDSGLPLKEYKELLLLQLGENVDLTKKKFYFCVFQRVSINTF